MVTQREPELVVTGRDIAGDGVVIKRQSYCKIPSSVCDSTSTKERFLFLITEVKISRVSLLEKQNKQKKNPVQKQEGNSRCQPRAVTDPGSTRAMSPTNQLTSQFGIFRNNVDFQVNPRSYPASRVKCGLKYNRGRTRNTRWKLTPEGKLVTYPELFASQTFRT